MIVVAEGVEDDATFDRLRTFACDLIQGYLVCRPISAAGLDTWLEDRDRKGPRAVSAA